MLIGWGWRRPRFGLTSHYFEAGTSLCGRWLWHGNSWLDRAHRTGSDRVCPRCLAELDRDFDWHLRQIHAAYRLDGQRIERRVA